jgi:hypothetical protein
MALIEIKHRYSGAVIFGGEYATVLACLLAAVASGANLYGADLYGANLYGADLYGADLYGADLGGANLYGADLYGANLYGADLGGANLRGANLYGADLGGANLRGANLYGADLGGANLYGADLYGADLGEKPEQQLWFVQTRILPSDGDVIGWKKCMGGVLVKLRIPAEAKRSHAFGRKCRAEYVEVLEVIGADVGVTDAHGPKTEYRAGEIVRPDSFCENWQDECSNGIHFFITRAEAEAY